MKAKTAFCEVFSWIMFMSSNGAFIVYLYSGNDRNWKASMFFLLAVIAFRKSFIDGENR